MPPDGRVGRYDPVGAAPFSLERVEAVEGADIEH